MNEHFLFFFDIALFAGCLLSALIKDVLLWFCLEKGWFCCMYRYAVDISESFLFQTMWDQSGDTLENGGQCPNNFETLTVNSVLRDWCWNPSLKFSAWISLSWDQKFADCYEPTNLSSMCTLAFLKMFPTMEKLDDKFGGMYQHASSIISQRWSQRWGMRSWQILALQRCGQRGKDQWISTGSAVNWYGNGGMILYCLYYVRTIGFL